MLSVPFHNLCLASWGPMRWLHLGFRTAASPRLALFAGPVCVPVLAPASCLGAPFGPPPCLIPPAYHPCMNSHARQGPSHVFGACAMSTQNQSACPLCPVPVEPNPCAGTRPSSAAAQRAVQLPVDPCACNCVLTGHTCCYWRSHIAQVIGTKEGWWSGPRLTGRTAGRAGQRATCPGGQPPPPPQLCRSAGRGRGTAQCHQSLQGGENAGKAGRVFEARRSVCSWRAGSGRLLPLPYIMATKATNPACLPHTNPTRTCAQQREARPRLKAQALQRAAAAAAALKHGGPRL